MTDKQIGFRVSEDVAKKLDKIVKRINNDVPEANVKISSLLRYATEQYIEREESKGALKK